MSGHHKQRKGIFWKLIDADKYEKIKRHGHPGYDATKLSFQIFTTIAYLIVVFFIIIGVPWPNSEQTPIPPEDLSYAIPVFILFYIILIGGLYLRDKLRK